MIKSWKKFNESVEDKLDDIESIFLELKDEDYKIIHEKFELSSDYPFTNEFIIYRKGNSGYYLNDTTIELFDLNNIVDIVLRFVDICKINLDKFRIIVSDGQFTLDITNKIHNLNTIDKSDIIETTHLHLKNSSGTKDQIDLKNIKFCSCQILK